MLFRRFVFGVLLSAARNPAVKKKAGDVAGKALKQARASLVMASRNAGELKCKAKQKLFEDKNLHRKNK